MNILRLRNFTDIIHGTIFYSGLEEAVLDCPLVSRLHRILQNSLAYITFPSNKVKRFEHSIGVMHLAGQMFSSAIANTNPDTLNEFFTAVLDELQPWAEALQSTNHKDFNSKLFGTKAHDSSIKNIKGRDFSFSPFYDRFVPLNVNSDYRFLYISLFQGIRLAGLLHDIGHLPYSHTLEKAINKLFVQVNKKKPVDQTVKEKNFIELYNSFCTSTQKKELHEELGLRMLSHVKDDVTNKIKHEDNPDFAVILMAFHIAKALLTKPKEGHSVLYDLHSIVSGTVDADRLDYASRDLFCSAICKDVINYNRIFMNLSIAKVTNDNIYSLVLKTKAIKEVEAFLYKRWNIFRDLNFHHSVHKSELLMMNKLIKDSADHLLDEKDFDLSHENIPSNFIEGIMFILSNMKENNDSESLKAMLIQLDDSWIDTVLKHESNPDDILSELISNRKEYVSIYKRFDDFLAFDKKLFDTYKNSEEVDLLIGRIRTKIYDSIDEKAKQSAYEVMERFINMTNSVTTPDELIEELQSIFRNEDDGSSNSIPNKEIVEVLKFLKYTKSEQHHTYWFGHHSLFCNALLHMLKGQCNNKDFMHSYEEDVQSEYDDLLIGEVNFKTGIEQLYLDTSNAENGSRIDLSSLVEFTDLSSQKLFLTDEQKLLPSFHLYIKRDTDDQNESRINALCALLFKKSIFVLNKYIDSC